MDGFHRGLWALIALVLIGMGTAGLLAGTGIIGPQWQTVMVSAQVAAEAQSPSRPTLVWLGMGGLVVLLLGLLLLRSTVPVRRTRRLASLRLGRHGSAASGTGNVTIVRGAALQHGVERDLGRIAGVERAQVVLEGSAEQLLLRVSLDVDVYADLSRIQAGVQGALQRLATTAGSPPASVEVLVHVQERRGRVRPVG